MAVIQVVEPANSEFIGSQLDALEGRFYVNPGPPSTQFSKQPEGFATDFQLEDPPDLFDVQVGNAARGAPLEAGKSQKVVEVLPYDFREQFWTERLHIFPLSVLLTDLGNLVNDVDTDVEVFNASRLGPVTISTIDEDGTEGFTYLVGRVPPPPFNLPAYNSEFYTIRAEKEEGPPTIAATFTWVPGTAGFASVSVQFTGARITIFTFQPEVEPVTVYEFATSIVESYNGTEQRMAMRENPRQSIRYRFSKGDDQEQYYEEAQAFEHAIFDSLGRNYAVPVWEDETVLTAAVGATDTVINVANIADFDFRVGELLLLWRDWDDSEAQEIEAIGGSTITTKPFTGAFAVEGTVVLPTFLGVADDQIRQQVFRVDHAKWELNFRRINNVARGEDTSPQLPAEYEGLPIWPRPWFISGSSVDRIWDRNVDTYAGQVGKLSQAFRRSTPRRQNRELRVEALDRTERDFMLNFVLALRGRQKAFWLPTLTNNFLLTANSVASSGVIRVRQNLYRTLVAQRAQLDRIQVTLTNGNVYQHTILASADVGTPPNNETDLTITPALAEDYTTTNVERIEYITKHRLDTDRIQVQSLRPKGAATIAFPIIEVINE